MTRRSVVPLCVISAASGTEHGVKLARIGWRLKGVSDWLNLEESDSSLETALCQIGSCLGEDTLLVCRSALDLRQLIHPAASREGFQPRPPFLSFVDASRVAAESSFPSDDNLLLATLDQIIASADQDTVDAATEQIRLGVGAAVCERTARIEDDVVVRARGLPWQATDQHVAQFFAGLNIAPGGIALCLSAEGRRNGEALVRFETPSHRALALRRHRHFLLNRYIEVYRATPDDFLQIAAGSSSEAVDFVSRGAAMIVRMRGLPFDCTDEQIRAFFMEVDCKVMDDGGVLFVTKPDGRPSGDAFVLFEEEAVGQRALSRHRDSIGSRYVELFRSSQAEVQQVVKRCGEGVGGVAGRRDCIRLRGLPYEARVEHVVDFIGSSASQIAPQGVHMVFSAQGHPSGEAFIQMLSEPAAAAVAASAHNKFMVIGKKQRYIEVFQCSPEDMNLMVANPARPLVPPPAPPPPPASSAGPPQPPLLLPAHHPRLFPNMAMPFGLYWPYPSPPVSPNMLLPSAGGSSQVLVTGLGMHVTPADLVAHFSSSGELLVECVEMLRWPSAACPGEAVVRLRPRLAPPNDLPPLAASIPPPFPLIHT